MLSPTDDLKRYYVSKSVNLVEVTGIIFRHSTLGTAYQFCDTNDNRVYRDADGNRISYNARAFSYSHLRLEDGALGSITMSIDNSDRFFTEDFRNISFGIGATSGSEAMTVEIYTYLGTGLTRPEATRVVYPVSQVSFGGSSVLITAGLEFLTSVTVPSKLYNLDDFPNINVA